MYPFALAISFLLAASSGASTVPSAPTLTQGGETQSRQEWIFATADRFGMQLTGFRIGSISPERPVAGQLAQLHFEFLFTAADAPSLAILHSLLTRSLDLQVGERDVSVGPEDITIIGVHREGDNFSLVGSITFRWPSTRTPIITTSETEVVSLQTRAMGGSADRLAEVTIRGAENLLLIAGLTAALYALAVFAWMWFRKQRRSRLVAELTSNAGTGAVAELSGLPGSIEESARAPFANETVVAGAAPSSKPSEGFARIPNPPEDLVGAIANGDAVLVLGSEASEEAGVPGGIKLLLQVIERLGTRVPAPLADVLTATDPAAKLASITQGARGPSQAIDVLLSAVSRADLAAIIEELVTYSNPGGRFFQSMAKCPWRAVVSLTWDRVAEHAFNAAGSTSPIRPVTVLDALDLPSSARSGERLLYKLLGDLERPSTVAYTLEEARRLLQRAPAFERSLTGLFQSRTFFFVGVDTDSIVQMAQMLTPDLESSRKQHYALVAENSADDLRQASLKHLGVQLLTFAGENAVQEFAWRLRRNVSANLHAHGHNDRRAGSYLSPLRIKRVKLEAIGPFDHLELSFEIQQPEARSSVSEGDPESDTAPWSVIFGGNGVGKSSILRAIALVLAGDHHGAAAAGRRLLRAGAPEGLIEIQMGEQLLRTRLTRDTSGIVVTSLQTTPLNSGVALVLGFPALRGARAPEPAGPTTDAEPRDPDPLDLLPLIGGEVDSRLANFKQWLVNTLVLARNENPRAVRMCDLLNDIIRDMVPGQIESLATLANDDFVIRVKTPEGEIPFDDLSQGMASIFNWVGLLVQRLFSICDSHEHANREPVIVLIDEIDAHLHPEWQRRLVQLTRRYFPNLQVIASSHSPLLAGALRQHELIVLDRDPVTNRVVQIGQVSNTFGMPTQDILLSSVFGMATDRNPEVETLIDQYLSSFQKAEPDEADVRQLQKLEGIMQHFRYGGSEPDLPEPPVLTEAEFEKIRRRMPNAEEGPVV